MVSYITNHGDYLPSSNQQFNLIDNYVYVYHTDTLIILPTFPESLSDNMPASYSSTSILGRSAPIYSYSGSGPRSVDIHLKLHRDMMNQINIDSSKYTYKLDLFADDDTDYLQKLSRKDYVDLMIKELQAIALPSYAKSEKMVNPPLVAVRFGDELFCKGIVDGGVTVQYEGPILANPLVDSSGNYILDGAGNKLTGKGVYALANISFKVTEVDPYDAHTVAQQGSLRGLNRSLERNLYRFGG